MRLGRVIGRVTLHRADPAYRGGRFVIVHPLDRATLAREELLPLPRGVNLVAFDALGAGAGDLVGFTEGGEAAAPFPEDCPVDAYVCALVDSVDYRPPSTSPAR